MPGEMLHQVQKVGQVARAHPLFVERENVSAALRLQMEIGILHAFRDALEAARTADVVTGQELFEILEGDIGVNGHARLTSRRAAR